MLRPQSVPELHINCFSEISCYFSCNKFLKERILIHNNFSKNEESETQTGDKNYAKS
jgi:hypothetical protein